MLKFYDGYLVSVVGKYSATQSFVQLEDDLTQRRSHMIGNQVIVNDSVIEDICNEVFKLDDKIVSNRRPYFGKEAFRGYVTGFEPQNNRVVCIPSEKEEDSRVRFAYKPYELEKTDDSKVEFKLGESYKLNGRETVTVMVLKTDEVLLVDRDSLKSHTVPRVSSKVSLALRHGIHNIQKMRG